MQFNYKGIVSYKGNYLYQARYCVPVEPNVLHFLYPHTNGLGFFHISGISLFIDAHTILMCSRGRDKNIR